MPEIKNINRTILMPFMSVILLLAVYLTANVLLPLKTEPVGGEDSGITDKQHLSDDAGNGEIVEMNIDFSDTCVVVDSGHGGADPGKVGDGGIYEKDIPT